MSSSGQEAAGRARPVGPPRLSIAVVTMNAAASLRATLESIAGQSYPHELVVVDGGSSDDTLAIAREPQWRAARVVSEADRGPYDAMEKAARIAGGEFILFMNAGDVFADPLAVEQALGPAPREADVIYGHHFWKTLKGEVLLHRAADFEDTWARLQRGDLHAGWQASLPCHQATFTRRQLLVELGYDPQYRIAADHDFLYRARRGGARFHHAGIAIAVYAQGGFSTQHEQRCFHEWWRIAHTHGQAAAATAYFRARFGVAVTLDPAALAPRVEALRASRLFFEDWYSVRQLAGRPHIAPIEHYIAEGASRGAMPMPFFDPAFYVTQHPGWAEGGLTPLEHAIREGNLLCGETFDWSDPRNPLAPLRDLFDPARETLSGLIERICTISPRALAELFPAHEVADLPALASLGEAAPGEAEAAARDGAAEAAPAAEADGAWHFLGGVSEVEEGPYPELGLDAPFRWCVGESSAFRLHSTRAGLRGLRLGLRNTQLGQAVTLLDAEDKVLLEAPLAAAGMMQPLTLDLAFLAREGAQTLVLRTARQSSPDALGRRVSVILESVTLLDAPEAAPSPAVAAAIAPPIEGPPRILWSLAQGFVFEPPGEAEAPAIWVVGREAAMVIESAEAVAAKLVLEYRCAVPGQQAMVEVEGAGSRPFFVRGGELTRRWEMPLALRAGRTRVVFSFRAVEAETGRALQAVSVALE